MATFLKSKWDFPPFPWEGETLDRPIALAERGPATADAAIPARVVVSVNTLVQRTDLGGNRFTFVAANTAIPVGLEGFPRIPA
jgi:hypothetical protein